MISFVFTNYNNSFYTEKVIETISKQKNQDIKILIVIVDNSSSEIDKLALSSFEKKYSYVKIIFNEINVGYFKGLNIGIKYIKEFYPSTKYLIIGNNDLEFPDTFLDKVLKCQNFFNKYPIISPDIITLEGEHQNPHVLRKISKFREVIYDLYYINYRLSKLILFLSKVTHFFTDRKDESKFMIPSIIYQGHGSCYILGELFLENFDELFAPSFLMNEEFFLSYQVRQKKMDIFYTPEIVVTHLGHATLKRVPGKKLWNISRESRKIYKKYIKLYNKF